MKIGSSTLVRLGAVSYLNARPLVFGLGTRGDRFSLRFDLPSQCAALLHARAIDVGLIPSIEYLQRPDYYIVPDVAIASQNTVASVALFTARPVSQIRTVAVDTSSRTSVMLLRVLCAKRFEISPQLVHMPPDLELMLGRCDAALMIGDPALFTGGAGAQKIDFGEEWRAMTNLPFVYAFWAGWPGVLGPADVEQLREVKNAGTLNADEVARQYFPDDDEKAAIGARYLRENVSFDLGSAELEGLRRFYEFAADSGFVAAGGELRFY